jgi:UDP-glucose 4-epimerase
LILCGKRILITGGAGFIGSHTADHLIREQPAEIRILDNFVRGRRRNLTWAAANGPVSLIDGDIRDRALVRRALDEIDRVFHQADIGTARAGEEPRLALEVLVEGTFNVLEASVRAGVQKVVAASSASVYGPAEEFPTTERHHPYNSRTLHAAAKAFDEAVLRSFNETYNLPYVALRYFDVYGPRMHAYGGAAGIFVHWMHRIGTGQSLVLGSDGARTMDLVHVHDVARANVLAAKAAASDQVLNVASGTETSLRTAADLLVATMGAAVPVNCPSEPAGNPRSRGLGSIRNARTAIGFEALVSLEQGLKSLVEWWRQDSIGAAA